MSYFWECPQCRQAQEKTDQLKLAAVAKEEGANLFASVRGRKFPCQFCGRKVDIAELADGKFDVAAPATPVDLPKPNPIVAFVLGGVFGGVFGGALIGWVIRFATGTGSGTAWVTGAIIGGVVGALLFSLSWRKG